MASFAAALPRLYYDLVRDDDFGMPVSYTQPGSSNWGQGPFVVYNQSRQFITGSHIEELCHWCDLIYERHGLTYSKHGSLESWKLPTEDLALLPNPPAYDGHQFDGYGALDGEWWRHIMRNKIRIQLAVGGQYSDANLTSYMTTGFENIWSDPGENTYSTSLYNLNGKLSKPTSYIWLYPARPMELEFCLGGNYNRETGVGGTSGSAASNFVTQVWFPFGDNAATGNTVRQTFGWWAESGSPSLHINATLTDSAEFELLFSFVTGSFGGGGPSTLPGSAITSATNLGAIANGENVFDLDPIMDLEPPAPSGSLPLLYMFIVQATADSPEGTCAISPTETTIGETGAVQAIPLCCDQVDPNYRQLGRVHVDSVHLV